MSFRTVYLVLALAGAVIPYAFFLQHLDTAGVDFGLFVRAAFANPVASGFTADLVVSSVVFWILMFRQRTQDSGPAPFLFIVLNLLVGLSCALPAWLYACSARKSAP